MKQSNKTYFFLLILVLFSPLGLSDSSLDSTGKITNQIINPSFEQHGKLKHKNWGLFKHIPGWQAELGDIEIQHKSIGGISAFDGLAKLELDAKSNSTLYQLIDTKIDQYYSLELYYSPRVTKRGTDSNNAEILWNNTQLKVLEGDKKYWQYTHFDVQADSIQTGIELTGAGKSDKKGALIDALNLTETPYTSLNLVQNPSFEQHEVLNGQNNGEFDAIPGWVVTQGEIKLLQHKSGGRYAAEGTTKLKLDSHKVNSHIEQTLETESGKRYQLSLSYAPKKNKQNSDDVQVFWNNSLLKTLKGDRGSWRRYVFDVSADSENSLLALYGAGRADNTGGHIDDVRLYSLPYVSENLIENGSFEQHGPLAHGQKWQHFGEIPGWTASQGEIEIQRLNTGGILAPEGRDKLELDAKDNSHVSQFIDTEAEQDYVLSFSYAPREEKGPADNNDVELWWDGQLLETLSGTKRAWHSYRYTVIATSESTLLEFRGAGTSNGKGGLIDDVRLYKLSALNSAPEFTSTPLTTAIQQVLYEYNSTAIDPQGETLVYSLNEAPAGMVIDSANGVISWLPTTSGIVQVSILVENTQGELDTQTYPINVLPINHTPVISSTPLTTATVGIPYEYPVIATDADNDKLSYSLAVSPPGMSINEQSGLIQWSAETIGAYTVTLWVTDSQGAKASQTYSITVLAPNIAPQIISTAPTEATENISYHYQVNATDPDNDPLSYTLSVAPEGMTINAGTGLIQWLPGSGGQYDVTIVIIDTRNAQDTQSYQILVANAAHAPVINSQAPTVANIDQLYQYQLNASDPDNDVLDYQLLAAPVGMHINSTTGLAQWTPVMAGSFNVNIRVKDSGGLTTEQSYAINVDYTSENQPPSLQAIGDQIIKLGTRYNLQLSASDPAGQAIQYSVSPLPLPTNASLNAQTGEFIFQPRAEQAGEYHFTFIASDGRFQETETVTFTVPEPNPAAPTRFIGRVLDATAKSQGIEIPIIGSTISFIGTDTSTITDANGEFVLDNIPDGLYAFSIDNSTAQAAPGGAGYASFHVAMPLVAHVDNIVLRPFTLPRIAVASQTQINPSRTAIVDNTEVGVKMTVVAGTAVKEDGSQFTGQLSISEVPKNLTPGSMPAWLQPGFIVTIQPLGVRFSTPAPITFPNTDKLSPGTATEIWSLDPDTGLFGKVGEGRVSNDGQRIETIAGGVRQSDWHFTIPIFDGFEPADSPYNPGCDKPKCNMGSTVSLADGRLNNDMSLPAYHSQGERRQLRFNYQSQFSGSEKPEQGKQQIAFPYRIRYKRITVSGPAGAIVPPMSIGYSFAGIENPRETFYNPRNIQDGESIKSSISLNTQGLKTGIYPVQVRNSTRLGASTIANVLDSTVTVVNEANSPYGAGWLIAGIDKLVAGPNGDQLLVSSSNDTLIYQKDADTQTYISPEADFSRLIENANGEHTLTSKYGEQQRFDAEGKQIATLDRNQNTTHYDYSGEKLQRIIDPTGLTTEFNYLSDHLQSISDPAGRITRFTHNAHGDLIKVTYPDNTTTLFEYADHKMTAKIDERGNRTEYHYNNNGQLQSALLADETERAAASSATVGLPEAGQGTQSNPVVSVASTTEEATAKYRDGRGHISKTRLDKHGHPVYKKDAINRETTFQRDADSNPILITRPNGSTLTQSFDAQGNVLTRTENFNNATTRYSWNQYSQVTSLTNPNQHSTTLVRDAQGNITRISNHLGHQTQLEYNPQGLITRSTHPNGLISDYHYNAQGLLQTLVETPTQASEGATRTSTYSYNSQGLLSQIITPDQIVIDYQYDARNRVTQISDQTGQNLSYTYDEYGNLIASQSQNADSSLALSVEQEYDKRNRLIKIIAPHSAANDSIYQYQLDRNSNLEALIDARQNSTHTRYDAVNRIITQTHQLDGETHYEYDTQDRITKITAPNGVATHYSYDLLGRRLSETSADRGTIHYQYDKADNITRITDARGIISQYQYDALERIADKTLPDSTENVHYTYDNCLNGIGRLCSISDESGQTHYRYDAYGNITEEIHTELNHTYTTQYRYDSGHQLSAITLPSNRSISYTRDSLRRLQSIRSQITPDNTQNSIPIQIVSDIQYRADQQMTQCTLGNGIIDQRSYDLQGRITEQTLTGTSSTILDRRHYDYDANGNIIAKQRSSDNTPATRNQYTYDPIDRLVNTATDNQPRHAYEYDLNHNREYSETNDRNTTTDYQYQPGGNRLSQTEANTTGAQALPEKASRHLQYNNAGRLYQLYEDGILIATYTYSAAGQRTRKVTIDGTIVYHYDQTGLLISETQADGTPIRDYLWQDGNLVAQIDNNGTSEQIRYLHTDHLATPRLATDANENIVWTWAGEAFGKDAAESLGATVNIRFPGQYFDVETGLVYNWNRYYDAGVGRYITSDPIGLEGGLNTYIYALNNPLFWVDPEGLSIKKKIAEALLILLEAFSDGEAANNNLRGRRLPDQGVDTRPERLVDKNKKKGNGKKGFVLPDLFELQEMHCKIFGEGCLPSQLNDKELFPSC